MGLDGRLFLHEHRWIIACYRMVRLTDGNSSIPPSLATRSCLAEVYVRVPINDLFFPFFSFVCVLV